MRIPAFVAFGLFALALPARAAEPVKPSAEQVEFFEQRIRPVLAEHCFRCHGEKQPKLGLRLDSRAALLKGSETGPVVVLGDPEQSSLIQAVRQTGDTKMPPKGKLPKRAIDDLAAWVKMGAPWPETTGALKTTTREDPRKTHWAFRPVEKPALPAVRVNSWVRTPVDAFVLARLEEQGMHPAAEADRRTLIRRVTFDLTGLPPTPEEVEAFVADRSPDAYEKVVERLLASPHYGERWGRHWLDVARYADTKGYVFNEERRFPYAYTYRDYVIQAFNSDLPYDQFVLQQLAADQLPLGNDRGPLAAMGYLTLGRRFLNSQPDIIDDRLDVVFRGLQGLTVGCARCHDHKFDPIPTRDYYSLYGVFASSEEPRDLPLLAEPEHTAAYDAFSRELQAREARVADFLKAHYAESLSRFRAEAADYLLAVRDAERVPGEKEYQPEGPAEPNRQMLRRWREYLADAGRRQDPVLAPWFAFAALPQKEFAAQAGAVAERIARNSDPKNPINPVVARAFAGTPPRSLREVAARYRELLGNAEKHWQETLRKTKTATSLSDADQEAVRQLLYGAGSPAQVSQAEFERGRYLDRKARDELSALRRRVEEWKVTSPVAPPRAMVLQDVPTPQEPHVFLRGNPNNIGDAVPRQFLQVLAGDMRKPFRHGSGRLELAQAIAARDNPLTARVLVNRVWVWHFGEGLVRTPSNFGLRGEPPTHPKLLDWLAATFMQEGWSIKKLHRLIVLSNTYRQASDGDQAQARIDPENRLLWKMNRQRLDFEELRDALLAVAGHLDPKQGGPAVELTTVPFATRRTVYGFIDRQNLPGLFRTFDFASPDTSSPQRFTTTVPQQALFLMNSPFVVEQARRVAARPELAKLERPEERIGYLYRLLYGRPPEPDEAAMGKQFVEAAAMAVSGKELGPWDRYAQVLLLANEFAFID